jgi:hypothetical protein
MPASGSRPTTAAERVQSGEFRLWMDVCGIFSWPGMKNFCKSFLPTGFSQDEQRTHAATSVGDLKMGLW